MNEPAYEQDDLIFALATGWDVSALALIRCSGPGCLEAAGRIFFPPERLAAAAGQTLIHGFIRDPRTGDTLDEVTAAVYRGRRSYTGEESLEIMAHGGLPGLLAIEDCLRRAGFRDAGPGEFTLRAFLNGKMDLTRAEAVQEIVSARTLGAHKDALRRLSGSVEAEVSRIRETLLNLAAGVELQLDYPEDEIDSGDLPRPGDLRGDLRTLGESLARLKRTFEEGRLYREGVRIALAGAVNAGKSSLFNRLLVQNRALTSQEPGTTRDYLEAEISLEGIPLLLYDTAGLRETESPVEREGIERSREITAGADFVLYLIDASGTGPAGEAALLENRENRLILWNKMDSPQAQPPPSGEVFPLSALTGAGVEEVKGELLRRIRGRVCPADRGEAVIASARQRDLLERAGEALAAAEEDLAGGIPYDLLAVRLREALDALGEITGETAGEEILQRMFSHFCVGK
ncbi:MAG: tRNA uridine-5-carboxymethylaminomethyl(34) synthesis GTPase MnmE [Spirochaetales bacterium]|nr:tRNA uridine-5-carboxymethylaminomethyl(34) synthesis GTPase MnmE [Spirochaetales bacterium]